MRSGMPRACKELQWYKEELPIPVSLAQEGPRLGAEGGFFFAKLIVICCIATGGNQLWGSGNIRC